MSSWKLVSTKKTSLTTFSTKLKKLVKLFAQLKKSSLTSSWVVETTQLVEICPSLFVVAQ